MIPSTEDLSGHTLDAFRQNRVVALDADLSGEGVPSIRLFPDAHVVHVFEHLRAPWATAVGAMRAFWERGLAVGEDVSVAAVNIEPPARFMTPAVTGLDTPDLSAVLKRCFDWFAGEAAWGGPLRLEPSRASLVVGESTDQAASHAIEPVAG